MPKEILYGAEARQALKNGVDKVANAVKVTLGPRGRNVIISNPGQFVLVTKDGVTVARNTFLKDQVEEVGAAAIREVALKTLNDSGDGTTTATVLAQAIIEEGMKLVERGANPVELKKGIDKAVEAITDQIKSMSVPVSGDMIKQVATVSANGDEEIGSIVAEAFEKIGQDGVVNLEDSHAFKTRVELIGGMQLNKGYISPFAVNNFSKMTSELTNVSIMVCDKTITLVEELFYVMNLADVKNRQALLIICRDMDGEALAAFNVNKEKSPDMPVCVIQAPEWGDSQKELMKDIAILTGATIIGDMYGTEITKMGKEDLGKCAKIVASKNETVLIGGMGNGELIDKRVMELKTLAVDAKDLDRIALETRAAKINGAVAMIYVGGSSQVEMRERKDRCDDSVRATRAAIQEGVVTGGGSCLFYCSGAIEACETGDIGKGIRLVLDILSMPLKLICSNAGIDPETVFSELAGHTGVSNMGYNARSEKVENMFESGILDPAKVVRVALQNAASIAGTLLTSECLMVEVSPQDK